VRNADQILVLKDGHIIERGRHDELIAMNGLYREIFDAQLRDQEELAGARTGDQVSAEESP
jgi:ABC-type transport system involved in cytochrome bd biosynthesis fused ATPase/permease subunit